MFIFIKVKGEFYYILVGFHFFESVGTNSRKVAKGKFVGCDDVEYGSLRYCIGDEGECFKQMLVLCCVCVCFKDMWIVWISCWYTVSGVRRNMVRFLEREVEGGEMRHRRKDWTG